MPIYEFTCTQCEKDFEILCPMGTQVNEVHCPACSKNQVVRKLSLFGCGVGFDAGEMDDSGGGCGSCGPSGCGCH